MLIVDFERQFVHMHLAIQRILLKFSYIQDLSVKSLSTIFLVHEFCYIMHEAIVIFFCYKINHECPPIAEILHDQDMIRWLKYMDYAAYNENLIKKVPPSILVEKISIHNDEFSIGNIGLGCVLGNFFL